MKLLVFAHTPPPVHGQSVMVETLINGLRGDPEIELQHVNVRLSHDATDIGRPRFGKALQLLLSCIRALRVRAKSGACDLYYVPAPGRRVPFLRDVMAMMLLRPFFDRLILHWHAVGLGGWLTQHATGLERTLGQRMLGRADLSIVLTPALRADAELLAPKKIAVVPNGLADPCPDFTSWPDRDPHRVIEVLFLGSCCEEKGLFDTAKAVLAANHQMGSTAFRLTAAGSFPNDESATLFSAMSAAHGGVLRHSGFVSGEAKRRLLQTSHCLCLPTRYPHEGQPLVLLEALAHGLPVVATDWRGISETLPPGAKLVPPSDTEALTRALLDLRATPPTASEARRHFLLHFTSERHVAAMSAALRTL